MFKKHATHGTGRETQAEKLHRILGDRRWHATKELARRVGHTFHVAIFNARHSGGHTVERRRHPTKAGQHQYRFPGHPNG